MTQTGGILQVLKSLIFAAGLVTIVTTWPLLKAAIAPGIFTVSLPIALALVAVYQVIPIAILLAAGEYFRRRGTAARSQFRALATAGVAVFVLLHVGGNGVETVLDATSSWGGRWVGLLFYIAISAGGTVGIVTYRKVIAEHLAGTVELVGVAGLVTLVFVVQGLESTDSELARYTTEIEPPRSAEATGVSPPVFVIVFDELSAEALMAPDGTIDGNRFPNFAALAHGGSLFTNARANYFNTHYALPSLAEDLASLGPLRSYIQFREAELAFDDSCEHAVDCRGITSLAAGASGTIFKHMAVVAAAELTPRPWNALTDRPLRWLAAAIGVPGSTVDPDGLHLFDEAHVDRFLNDLQTEVPEGTVYLLHTLSSHYPYVRDEDGGFRS